MYRRTPMLLPDLLTVATDSAYIPSKIKFLTERSQKQTLILNGREKITLRHHKNAFVGCFSLRLRKNINWELFKLWKEKRYPSVTEQMARDFILFIQNHYDLITTAPPSSKRDPLRYCTYDLAKAISRKTGIPFVPAFSQKTDKYHHGRHASLNQSKPKLLESWNIHNRVILFIDDCITTGTTARLCYEALIALGNHIDGLIWVSA